MEKYENLGVVGEGSYGVVIKCRHKETGQIVAIKKFLEGEEDAQVKKIAMREVRMLKRLRHENLVNLLEVFRRRKRLCLVFEFVENTVLDLLEAREHGGLDARDVRGHVLQVLRGLQFCHSQNVIHRDIKPENVLVSNMGVVKLCDFGFARPLAAPGENCTDYVATRWYRAPELLVGDTKYGREVDVWATGCLFAEMLSGDPLFPGDSDIDQLFHIIQNTGPLCRAHAEMLSHNAALSGLRVGPAPRPRFTTRFPSWHPLQLQFLQDCLEMDPDLRPTCSDLLQHEYFTHDDFPERFIPEMRRKLQQEFSGSSLGRKFAGLGFGKKRKSNKQQTPNKENHSHEHPDATIKKDVRDVMKASPYRQTQARISVGRLTGAPRIDQSRSESRLDPPVSGEGGGASGAVSGHGWVRDALVSWGIPGLSTLHDLAGESLTSLLPRTDRRRPSPVSAAAAAASNNGRSPGMLRRAREPVSTAAGPAAAAAAPACQTCQEVTARGHPCPPEKASPRLAAMERLLRQRRTSDGAKPKPGLSLPNVPGALSSVSLTGVGVSRPAGLVRSTRHGLGAAGLTQVTGGGGGGRDLTQVGGARDLAHLTTLDLLQTPVSVLRRSRTRPWWH